MPLPHFGGPQSYHFCSTCHKNNILTQVFRSKIDGNYYCVKCETYLKMMIRKEKLEKINDRTDM
jgi:hypothetical protein